MREQLERVFAPLVSATAGSHTEWGRITLAFMKWGYDLAKSEFGAVEIDGIRRKSFSSRS